MNKVFFLAILFVLQFAIASDSTPFPPLWPNVFVQDFVEISTFGNLTTRDVGTYYYNYTNNTQCLSRSNGQFDLFCGFNKIEPLAYYQVVFEDKRYIYFPELNDCCYCCGLDDGYAVLNPYWFINPQFLRAINCYGVPAYKWVVYEKPNQQGPNQYIETNQENPLD
ncbi:hypothetical protein ABPG72_012317 [Tetrahymena utriculariae]